MVGCVTTVKGQARIDLDDPRRLINLCVRCHKAIHDHELILDRWRDGLHFELDRVTEEEALVDMDMLCNSEGECVWSQQYGPVPPDDQFREAIERFREGSESALKPMFAFLPYAQREHYEHLMMEATDLSSIKLDRFKTAVRVNWLDTKTFGWDNQGRPKSRAQRIEEAAERWGCSVSTIKDDITIAELLGTSLADDHRYRKTILEEARQKRAQARGQTTDEPGCDHLWTVLMKRCRLCGEQWVPKGADK